MTKKRIFSSWCTGNSARSQMARACFEPKAASVSRCSVPAPSQFCSPGSECVMKEIGIDISAHRSSLSTILGQSFDYVVTVCDNARDNCPVFPAGTERFTGASKILPP